MPTIVSVNVGMPRDVPWQGRTVRTGVWKSPVAGPVFAGRLNLAGDGQGDLEGHGGEQRAVMVYQVESYRYWEAFFGWPEMAPGSFGENFTIAGGLPDAEVCIGDRYRIGEALFEVTQPRVTCYRVGLRLECPQLPALLVSHRRPGFYFRVVEEGVVQAGDVIEKIADGPERMSVVETDALLYTSDHPVETLQRALRIPALSVGWQGSFKALLDAARAGAVGGNAGLAAVAPKPAWAGFRPLRVAAVARESDDIRSFTLQAADGSPLPPFLPGQHIVLRLKTGGGPSAITRIYSLCGAPDAGVYRIAVKDEGGPGSAYLSKQVRAGDVLEASAPRGTFILGEAETPLVLLSGGVGVTPVLAMLHVAVATRSRSKRTIWWIHSARNGAANAFAQEVRDLLAGVDGVHSWIVYSRPGAADKLGADYDAQGHIDAKSLRDIGVPLEADFYLCGPPGFLADLENGLAGLGIARDSIHAEVFGVLPSVTPGVAASAPQAPHQPDGPPGSGPSVTFVRSGLTTRWDARFRTLLELAESCSVPVRWSCRTGVCHTCETGIFEGRIGYAPEPVDPPADGAVLICCASPTSDVDLDL
jgi:ferredoxin-NADP reductase/MOSC domain-containing protein YiiM